MSTPADQPAAPPADSGFGRDWVFLSVVKEALGASSYELAVAGHFRTGRPKWSASFYSGWADARTLITTRDAMELVSRSTGRKYFVCRSAEPAQRGYAPADIEDVFVS